MKICVTSTGETIEAEVDPRFGRCRYFLVVDTDHGSVECISNESVVGGAGVKAAQTVAKTGAKVVLTGNIGPNAFQVLQAAGIKVFTDVKGKVKDAIENYKKGLLRETVSPTVDSHSGIR